MQEIFLSLIPYTAVIQLLAGSVYVVYFFDQKANDPFERIHKALDRRYVAFNKKYQGSLTIKQRQHFKNIREADVNWWNNALVSLLALSKFSCVYCVLILLYISEESYFFLHGYLFGLLVASIIIALYLLMVLFLYGCNNKLKSWLQNPTIVYCLFCFVLIIFYISSKINNFCVDNNLIIGSLRSSSVYLLTVFVCFESLFCRFMAHFYHKFVVASRFKSLEGMNKRIKSISFLLNNALGAAIAVNDNDIELLTKNTRKELQRLSARGESLSILKAIELTNNEISHIYSRTMRWGWISFLYKKIFSKDGLLIILILIFVGCVVCEIF